MCETERLSWMFFNNKSRFKTVINHILLVIFILPTTRATELKLYKSLYSGIFLSYGSTNGLLIQR